MHPFAVSLPAQVLAVAVVSDGYAASTGRGIELLAPDLAQRGAIPGTVGGQCDALCELADGRLLAFRRDMFTSVFVGHRGGAVEPVFPLDAFSDSPCPTRAGFVANYDGRLWIDEAGRGRWVDHGVPGQTRLAFDDRLVVGGARGLAIIDHSGAVRARFDSDRFTRVFAACGAGVAIVQGFDRVAVLDAATLTEKFSFDLPPAAQGFGHADRLVLVSEPTLASWDLATGACRWTMDLPASDGLNRVYAVGDRLVVDAAGAREAWILDADTGALVAQVGLDANLRGAHAFGDGIAFDTNKPALTLWLPTGESVPLAHDACAANVTTVPAGLITTERRHVYLWRRDASGPAFAPVSTHLPFGVPIVVDGVRLRALAPGRFYVVAALGDRTVALEPDATWRPLITQAAARAIVDRLIARATDGALPAPTASTSAGGLAQLPPEDTATLYARALFAPTTLDAATLEEALWSSTAFFAELAQALEVSPRVVAAAVRAGRFPLTPPRDVPGYDYLGAFETGGDLRIADPAYVAKSSKSTSDIMVTRVKARAGRWHAFARSGSGDDADRTAELVAMHEDGFALYANDEVGVIGVDSGCAGIYDRTCPEPDVAAFRYDGIQHDRGVLAHSGYGDGGYLLYAARVAGEVVKLRLAFFEDADADRAYAPPTTARRPYAPGQRFALGETVAHPTFGVGVVTAVLPDAKIVVAFSGGTRTLVHGRS